MDIFRSHKLPLALSQIEDGRFCHVNDAFLRMFGWTRAEVIGKTPIELGMHAHAAGREEILAALQAGHPVPRRRVEVLAKSGRTLVLFLNVRRLRLGSHEYVLDSMEQPSLRDRASELV